MVRLANSSLSYEGRLEVYHDGVWGTVCDDYFDDVDASVACHGLGYGSASVVTQLMYIHIGYLCLDVTAVVDLKGSSTGLSPCFGSTAMTHSQPTLERKLGSLTRSISRA